jgi:hypothetical protein
MQHRALHSLPQLQGMHQWLTGLQSGVANGGALAKAIDYTIKRWPALIRYALPWRTMRRIPPVV